jgi:hypothetical protein
VIESSVALCSRMVDPDFEASDEKWGCCENTAPQSYAFIRRKLRRASPISLLDFYFYNDTEKSLLLEAAS